MPRNEALWLPARKAAPKVSDAPYPNAGAAQIVVRSAAVSINPIDWILQSMGGVIFPWLEYPLVLGWDVAGEVVEVGGEVTRFHIGDRVFGLAVAQNKSVNDPAEGAFQTYAVLREHMASPIPDSMTYEQAAVLPLGLSTAACALFQKDQLALSWPTDAARPRPSGETVLVWGGSTSVGCNAIQLTVAAGYDVFTTASPHNHEYVRGLGAVQTFDYRGPTVVREIVQALKGRRLAGALAIGVGSTGPCLDIVGACQGRKFVAVATPPVSFEDAPNDGGGLPWVIGKVARLAIGNVGLMLRARRHRARMKFIDGSTLLDDGVGHMIYVDFLPNALGSGRYQTAPAALVTGDGLSAIPEALEIQKQGVSARKVVVRL